MGEHHTAALPSAMYGVVLLMSAIAYFVLQRAIMASQGAQSLLASAVGADRKGKLSPVIYLAAIVCSSWWVWLAQALYVAVALMWLVPDKRIERALGNANDKPA
jgi:uncharacterized membrane protein